MNYYTDDNMKTDDVTGNIDVENMAAKQDFEDEKTQIITGEDASLDIQSGMVHVQ